MGRRKKVESESETEPLARLPQATELAGTALQSPTDARRERELEDVLQEVGSDGRIRIWHVTDGKSHYAGEMSLDGFTLDALLEHYGGGDKTLAFYQGRTRVDTLRVSLDPSIPPTNPREQKLLAQREQRGATGGTGIADLSTFLVSMAQSNMSNMDMFTKMMLLSSQQSQSMIQAITTMMTARPERDPMDLALKMAELLKPTNAGGTAEALTMFREGLNLARDMGGSDDDGTTSLIGKGLDVVGQALGAAQRANHSPNPPVNGSPVTASPVVRTLPVTPLPEPLPEGSSVKLTSSGTVEPQQVDDPTAPHTGDRPWIAAARPMIPRLASALMFLSGDSAAIELTRRASDDVINDLMDDLDDETAPGFLGRLQATFPMFQPSAEWAQQFIDELRSNVTVDAEDGDDDTGVS